MVTTEASENDLEGIESSLSKKVAGPLAQLKCIYTNAWSVDNKQEKTEATMQQEN